MLFLLYHYFEAREMYNAIRVFIAGYVWMTGYNNFSYYYRTKDFNVARSDPAGSGRPCSWVAEWREPWVLRRFCQCICACVRASAAAQLGPKQALRIRCTTAVRAVSAR